MKCAQKRTNVSYGNPIIAEIETAKTFNRHRAQLKSIRPSIDTNAPKPQPHLQLYGRDYFAKKRAVTEAAFQDLKMIQSIARTMTRPYVVASTKGPVSLNCNYRKKELFRITMENHQLLDRLENLQPVISRKKMDDDHRVNQLYMVNASYSARKVGAYDSLLNRQRRRAAAAAASSGGQSHQLMGSSQQPALQSVQSMPALSDLPAAAPKEEEAGGGSDYENEKFEDE